MTIPRKLALRAASATALALLGATALAQETAPIGPAVAGPVVGEAQAAAIASNAPRFTQTSGEDLYMNVCAACHMPDGQGAQGAGFYPSLAGNPKLAAGAYPAYVVLKGMNGMPAVGEMMDDAQVAEVVNYVRTHFGNDFDTPMQPADVAALR